MAALLQQLESGAEPAAEPEPAPAAEPESEPAAEASPEPAAATEEVDPELAALLNQLESGDEHASATPAETGPTDDPSAALQAEIDDLGGAAALEKLGWPVFAPAFMSDLPRLLKILKANSKNRAVEKEVADLVKKCGGYPALAPDGIRADLALNVQLAKLRELRKAMDADAILKNLELADMAEAYGANLKRLPSPKAKSDLLSQVREYDKWASDGRNTDLAASLDGCPFKERRQAQLEHQMNALGGSTAFAEALKAHPANLDGKTAADIKVAVLKALKEYNKLGGDAAFVSKVGNDPETTPLLTKLEQLKTVTAAQE